MRSYETVLVFPDGHPEEKIDETTDKLKKLVEGSGGQEIEVQPWGRQPLATKIKDNKAGKFVFLQYTSPPSVCGELDAAMRIDDNIIRYQTFHYEGEPAENDFHFKNYERMVPYITDRGKIRPARATRLNARAQRRLSRHIKRARMLGLLPITTLGN